jgi:hypothetical protein
MTPEVFDGIVDLVKKQKRRVARDRLKDNEAWRGEGWESTPSAAAQLSKKETAERKGGGLGGR